MVGWRDIKRKARRDLHRAFEVPAIYRAPGSTIWVNCRVRVHDKIAPLGQVEGVNYIYAEREEAQPKIIFLASEVVPHRGGIVSVDVGEAYRVDHTEPRDNITISAPAYRLGESELAGLPTPNATDEFFLCGANGFDPAAQFGEWEASMIGSVLKFGNPLVANFTAPFNTHTWENGDFLPRKVNEVYDFQIKLAVVSGIVDNFLTVQFGTFTTTIPISNVSGAVNHYQISAAFMATDLNAVPIIVSSYGPMSITEAKISVSPRVIGTPEAVLDAAVPSTYHYLQFTGAFPVQIENSHVLDMSSTSVIIKRLAPNDPDKALNTGADLAANPGKLYDVQIRADVTSQIIENSLTFTLGGVDITKDIPAASGLPVSITASWIVRMDDPKAVTIKSDGPMRLNSATIEIIPR